MEPVTLASLAVIVAVLTSFAKQLLPEDPRNRYTPCIALALGLGAVFAFALTRPGVVVTGDLVLSAIVQGLTMGFTAVGMWNAQDNARNPGGK